MTGISYCIFSLQNVQQAYGSYSLFVNAPLTSDVSARCIRNTVGQKFDPVA